MPLTQPAQPPKAEPEKKDEAPAPAKPAKEEAKPKDDPVPVVWKDPQVQPEVKAEPKKEEPPKEEPKKTEPPKQEEPAKPEPPKEEAPKEVQHSEEYTRSVKQMQGGANISEETFNEDKKKVLAIIENLDEIMKKNDYKAWLTYLDDESIKYWSQRSNLQKVSKRLPIKGVQINSMEDYFKYIFIPSRSGHKVDEIRYLTETSVKAVQVKKDEDGTIQGDTVYYNLRKINGQWKLHLPTL
ncbi:MAG TPA: hypothetical protein DDW78_10845 [Treponema sp.]|nr:hypothetical protein [Treponema sp.]